ncbi:hypothetical protein GCM10025883_45310 [Mobilicoccus caccae]|uniref:Uncharacterized protein n=1 Tax=Mobilicoccus caccae TaxID=1859295 RepID=A0ABQ6IYK7_9MICO|nr:hypothetical protein GCM10025883_45310 [Mobilicoccus caccae]
MAVGGVLGSEAFTLVRVGGGSSRKNRLGTGGEQVWNTPRSYPEAAPSETPEPSGFLPCLGLSPRRGLAATGFDFGCELGSPARRLSIPARFSGPLTAMSAEREAIASRA